MVKEMHEAMLWKKERNGVRCFLCARRCFVSKGKLGFCKVRKNVENRLYTLNYGKVVALNVDNVEKNLTFHFYPGSKSLSFGLPGCNFFSPFCPEFELNSGLHEKSIEEIKFKEQSADDIVKAAEKENCKSISYTFTEPAMFMEFAYKTAKLAHRSNIKNIFVTNGYMSEDAVKKIAKYLDAATINLKASADPEFYKNFISVSSVKPIFDALKQMKKHRIFIEITNLIVPKIGDDIERCRKLAQRISSKLSPEIPFHIVQFHPTISMPELPPTPVATLERCAEEARKTGLRYVYIDAIEPHREESTYCYNCRELLIKRVGLTVKKNNLVGDRCPNCGMKINVVI